MLQRELCELCVDVSCAMSLCAVRVALQVSERLLHKYGCLLSAPLSALLLRPGQALVTCARVWASVRAMAAHKSQWVW